jgi:class 3 adenylate cyclase
MFDEVAKYVPMGAIDEVTMRRGAAVSGESARRLATWGMGFFATFIDEPIRRSGGGPQEVLDAAATFTQLSRGSLETQFLWLLRRAIEHHTTQYVVTLTEEAIQRSGIAVPRPARPPAIAFLDLSGCTSMTEQLGDDAAADRSLLLARVVQQPVGDRGGEVIKLLGDGVLMHFPRARAGRPVRAGPGRPGARSRAAGRARRDRVRTGRVARRRHLRPNRERRLADPRCGAAGPSAHDAGRRHVHVAPGAGAQ